MSAELDLEGLLAVLARHRVVYVMIGGMAAVTHGSPFPTEDLDITPAGAADNLERLSAALDELGARVRVEGVDQGLPFEHDAVSLGAVERWNLTTRCGDLDVTFVPAGTHGYDDLVKGASEVELFGVTVAVCSLADVVRSKQAANRPKDQRALPTLRELLARTNSR
ncbi:MAG: hypothetical protein QM650_08465 [Microlunatus sp.]